MSERITAALPVRAALHLSARVAVRAPLLPRSDWRRGVAPWLGPALLVACWQLACSFGGVPKDGSGIDGVKDLAGRSVAVNRSGLGEFLLIAALEKYGVDRSKVQVVYLNPPDAAPAFGSGKVDAWAMWSPQVDIARTQYTAHGVFLEGRDLAYRIDFNSWLVRKPWADRNPDLVRAVNAALAAEAQWAIGNVREAEVLTQKRAGYSDEIRDFFITQKRSYSVKPVDDTAFIAELQNAADWLTVRKILPDSVVIADHLVKLPVS